MRGHGFDDRHTEPFCKRGVHHRPRIAVKRSKHLVADVLEDLQPVAKTALLADLEDLIESKVLFVLR